MSCVSAATLLTISFCSSVVCASLFIILMISAFGFFRFLLDEEVDGSSSADNGEIGVNSTEHDSEGDGRGIVVNTDDEVSSDELESN